VSVDPSLAFDRWDASERASESTGSIRIDADSLLESSNPASTCKQAGRFGPILGSVVVAGVMALGPVPPSGTGVVPTSTGIRVQGVEAPGATNSSNLSGPVWLAGHPARVPDIAPVNEYRMRVKIRSIEKGLPGTADMDGEG